MFLEATTMFLKVSLIPLESTCVGVFFSLKWWNYIKIFVLQNKPYFCRNFFLLDWRHKCLKKIKDLLLFYRVHYRFSESDLWKRRKKKHICLYRSQTFWSLMKFYFVHIVKVCFVFKKQSLNLYSSVYS